MRTRAVAYIRVSTRRQAEQGLSLAAQREKIAAYAKLYDLKIIEVVVDRQTAKNLRRPALQHALGLLRSGKAAALLVVKLDRLTRSVRDLGQLIEEWFAPGQSVLLSVGEQIDTRSAAGRLVLNVLTSVAQWEREAIGERTAAVLQHKAHHGEYIGGQPPFGWKVARDGTHLVRDRREQQVRTMARRLGRRGLSLRGVARDLARRGFTSRTGRGFAPVQIQRLLAA